MADSIIEHYGVKRRSGRYPWGSGGELLKSIDRLSAKGLSEKEIASGLDLTIRELRNQKSLAKAEVKEGQRLNVIRQKQRGMSISAISRETGIASSTIRDLLQTTANVKFEIVQKLRGRLQESLTKYGLLDVGEGTEEWLGVSRSKLDNAISLMTDEGYKVYNIQQEQLGSDGSKKTTIKVLAPPGTEFKDVIANKSDIAVPGFFSNDEGVSFFEPDTINNFSSDRILVKYADDGGGQKDGLIEMRKGVPELSLGGKAYAQVRIGVDDTHFMKGMAVLKDDMPDGVDIIYNTSAKPTGNKLDAMKLQQDTGVSKFGAVVKPNTYLDADGNEQFGVVNIVGERKLAVEGNWSTWKKNIASQVLSKQSHKLAEQQLKIIEENRKAELEEISSLTDPTVRSHLLTEFADKTDKAAVDLKAAALPRQTTNVLLPDPKLRPNEIYAPNYENGETVVLLRYPHGGTFEIPTLKVNNKTSDYRNIIGTDAPDAVAVHPDTAQRLSGADFDGDFVMVIPNKRGQIKTEPALAGLKDFHPKEAYPKYDGMQPLSEDAKQRKMGDVSNLITDMTIQGANQSEIARAVRHSMVVIDAAKHELNYKQSEIDNGIKALKTKYQGGPLSGAATLVSRTTSQYRVPQRHDHYEVDALTGEKVFTYTDKTYIDRKTGKTLPRLTKSKKGAEIDPFELISDEGTAIERVYATHAKGLKDLANKARLGTVGVDPRPYDPKARRTYSDEVASLNIKFKDAVKARPIERKAQLLAAEIYKAKVDSDPAMSKKDKKTWKGRSLVVARSRLGHPKPTIDITQREWTAIEMGAVSPTRLKGILRNADMDKVRQYATPRAIREGLSGGKKTRATRLLGQGYTTAEVAAALGVPVSQVQNIDKD
jgi:transcriptional regulator with XRE-family HTH domain/DNA-binding CsgD family transcriptional regulator